MFLFFSRLQCDSEGDDDKVSTMRLITAHTAKRDSISTRSNEGEEKTIGLNCLADRSIALGKNARFQSLDVGKI